MKLLWIILLIPTMVFADNFGDRATREDDTTLFRKVRQGRHNLSISEVQQIKEELTRISATRRLTWNEFKVGIIADWRTQNPDPGPTVTEIAPGVRQSVGGKWPVWAGGRANRTGGTNKQQLQYDAYWRNWKLGQATNVEGWWPYRSSTGDRTPDDRTPRFKPTNDVLRERLTPSQPFEPPEPFEPPPSTTTETALGAPRVEDEVIDKGSRTTYNASDGRPIQGQNNQGYHRARGSATLSSGEVIFELSTSVGGGRNDMSFLSVESYSGRAWSLDTSNGNTYTVTPLDRNRILIKSSSGADNSTVQFIVEGD